MSSSTPASSSSSSSSSSSTTPNTSQHRPAKTLRVTAIEVVQGVQSLVIDRDAQQIQAKNRFVANIAERGSTATLSIYGRIHSSVLYNGRTLKRYISDSAIRVNPSSGTIYENGHARDHFSGEPSKSLSLQSYAQKLGVRLVFDVAKICVRERSSIKRLEGRIATQHKMSVVAEGGSVYKAPVSNAHHVEFKVRDSCVDCSKLFDTGRSPWVVRRLSAELLGASKLMGVCAVESIQIGPCSQEAKAVIIALGAICRVSGEAAESAQHPRIKIKREGNEDGSVSGFVAHNSPGAGSSTSRWRAESLSAAPPGTRDPSVRESLRESVDNAENMLRMVREARDRSRQRMMDALSQSFHTTQVSETDDDFFRSMFAEGTRQPAGGAAGQQAPPPGIGAFMHMFALSALGIPPTISAPTAGNSVFSDDIEARALRAAMLMSSEQHERERAASASSSGVDYSERIERSPEDTRPEHFALSGNVKLVQSGKFKDREFREGADSEARRCCICQENVSVVLLAPCAHRLCHGCTTRLQVESEKCPLCRAKILAAMLPFDEEGEQERDVEKPPEQKPQASDEAKHDKDAKGGAKRHKRRKSNGSAHKRSTKSTHTRKRRRRATT